MPPKYPYFKHFDQIDIDLTQLEIDIVNLLTTYKKRNPPIDIWHSHPGYQNQWFGISLKNSTGSTDAKSMMVYQNYDTYQQRFKPGVYTEYIQLTPYIRTLLDQIQQQLNCEIHLVRILKMDPETVLNVHTDGPCFNPKKHSMYRLHIPIQTNPRVQFRIYPTTNSKVYQEQHLKAGHLYFVDVSKKHCVINPIQQERIHLVIDCSDIDPQFSKVLDLSCENTS